MLDCYRYHGIDTIIIDREYGHYIITYYRYAAVAGSAANIDSRSVRVAQGISIQKQGNGNFVSLCISSFSKNRAYAVSEFQ